MIPLFAVHMPDAVDAPLLEVLHSGYIGQGPKVKEFECRLADWLCTPYVLTVNAGTSALHLALRLAGVGPDAEVISTPMTCSATNTPIVTEGAVIRWADINPRTGNIDPDSVRRLASGRTRAIMCVHFGGYPCDLDEIHEIADEHGIPVIEDAAHAFGATYHGRPIGSISHFTEFSLQAIKHITTIDGGVLSCRDKADCERGRLLRWYGIDREGPRQDMRCEIDIAEAGFKYHMNDIAATIGIIQLRYVNTILSAHQANAYFYDDALRGFNRITPLDYADDRTSAYWLYTVLVDSPAEFIAHMAAADIQASRVHSRCDTHSCFKSSRSGPLPGVDEFTAHQVSIPVHWALTFEERERIVDTMRKYERGE